MNASANNASISLTDKAKTVLGVIASGLSSREDVAAKLKVSVPVVNGSLTSLKRHGLVEIDDETGAITATPDAADHVGAQAPATRAVRTGTKMERARGIFDKYVDKGRQVVLEHFKNKVGLTQAGASTYYQTLRSQNEMAGMAYQKGKRPAAKKAVNKTVQRRKAKS